MKLKEFIVSANTGLDAIKRAPILNYETDLRCIRIQDISQSKPFEEWGYTKTTEKDYKKFKLKKDDILIARTGATVGVSYIAKEDYNAVFNNGTIRLRFNDKINTSFVYHIFQTKEFKQFIDNISCVATQPNLRVENLLNFTIPDIDIQKQNKIADILEKYDLLIQNNNMRITKLEQMADQIYKQDFVSGNYINKRVRLSKWGFDLECGSRPKGGIDSSLQDGVPSLGAESIDKLGFFDYSNIKYISEEFYKKIGRGQVKDNDILIYKDGAYIGKVTFFKDGFPFEKCTVNEHVFLFRSKNPEHQLYLYFTLKTKEYFKLMQNLNRNAAQPGLATKDIESIKISMPSRKKIIDFNKKVEPILDMIFKIAKENKIIKEQQDLLLPRLISGKLEI